jgi:hypothetical protein
MNQSDIRGLVHHKPEKAEEWRAKLPQIEAVEQ